MGATRPSGAGGEGPASLLWRGGGGDGNECEDGMLLMVIEYEDGIILVMMVMNMGMGFY